MFRAIKKTGLTSMLVLGLMYGGDKYNVSAPIDAVIHAYDRSGDVAADFEERPEATIDYLVDRVIDRLYEQ